MRRPLYLILILCLALTGFGLGTARGTVMLAGKVVICTGQGVVVMDHPAAPGRPHVCPDMALALLSGMPVLTPDIGPARNGMTQALPQPAWQVEAQGAPVPAARGPPAGTAFPASFA